MTNMRAFMVAVDYDDLLAVTIPYNRHHFDEVWVITTTRPTPALAQICVDNRVRVWNTDAFYRDGAAFNKWSALEECLDYAGRKGWTCLMDADVLWPKELPVHDFTGVPWLSHWCSSANIGRLCTPRRRMAPWPVSGIFDPLVDEEYWHHYPPHRNEEFAGWTQIFHADDPVLQGTPWHETNWKHAGGADSFFQAKWPEERKVRPPWECLHLGEAGQNWYGRATPLADGTRPTGADDRLKACRDIWTERRRIRLEGGDPFGPEKLR